MNFDNISSYSMAPRCYIIFAFIRDIELNIIIIIMPESAHNVMFLFGAQNLANCPIMNVDDIFSILIRDLILLSLPSGIWSNEISKYSYFPIFYSRFDKIVRRKKNVRCSISSKVYNCPLLKSISVLF